MVVEKYMSLLVIGGQDNFLTNPANWFLRIK